jgi:hypothetical protein
MARTSPAPFALSTRGYRKLAVNGKSFPVWLPLLTRRDTKESRPQLGRVEHYSTPTSYQSCVPAVGVNGGNSRYRFGDAVAFGGEGEIRSHESREGLPVFKSCCPLLDSTGCVGSTSRVADSGRVRAMAGRVFNESRREWMIWIDCLRLTSAHSRAAQPNR